MHRNLRLLMAFHALRMALFIMPVVVVFWKSNGLDLTRIMLLQVLFSATVIALEVPTGYAADILGRKASLLAGCALGFAGMLGYAFGHGFWSFLAAEVILGAGLSLLSGTDTAVIYDTLLEEGKAQEFTRIQGEYLFVGQVSEAVAAILGGLMADVHLRLPFFVTAGAMLGALACVAGVREPHRDRTLSSTRHGQNLRAMAGLFTRSAGALGRSLVFLSVLSSATLLAVWLYQPHWEWAGIPLSWFGALWAGVNLTVAFAGRIAYRVDQAAGRRATLLAITGLPAAGYLGMALWLHPIAAAWAVLFSITRGFTFTLLKDELNRHAGSQARATINSAASLGSRLIFSLVAVPVGWIGDRHGVPTALIFAATLYGILGPAGWWWWQRGTAGRGESGA